MSKFVTEEIPFLDYVVSWENFDSVPDYENFNLEIKKYSEYNMYSITFKNHIPANMYYYCLDGKYAYSFNEYVLADFLGEKGIELTINENWEQYQAQAKKQDSSLKHNKYNEIERISLYSELKVFVDHFEKRDIEDLFSVSIHEAGDIIKSWLERYKNLVAEKHNFICVELSSGLDTRSLTYFWRDYGVYHIYTKQDDDEIPIVQELCEKHFPDQTLIVGHKEHFIKDESGKTIGEAITLSGKGMDVFTLSKRYLSTDFYTNNICYLNYKHLIKYICPYLDKELLKIKPDYPGQLKIVMQYLLASDLMDVKYKSFKREPFIFTPDMKHMAMDLLAEWGINEK